MTQAPTSLTERGLERRIKRHLKTAPQAFFCPCAPGFEAVLKAEIAALPEVSELASERGGVSFSAPLQTLYSANLNLRTAHRVLLRVDEFLAQSYPMLFDHARRVSWELYLGFADTYSVRVSAKESRLRHHKKLAETVQAAVAAKLEPLGLQPVQADAAELSFQLRLYQDRATLSLDTSGEHLHKRGYRKLTGVAPLRETLAAGVVLAAGNVQPYDFVLDPMCGTGTLLIEAAQMASGRAPGLTRAFGFEHAAFYQDSLWQRLNREAQENIQAPKLQFLGIDTDAEAIKLARRNAAQAGVGELISFEQGDARALNYAELTTDSSLLLSNVPYGERLSNEDEVSTLLSDLATALKQAKGAFSFVTQNEVWLQEFKPSQKLVFSNGGLTVKAFAGTFS